MSPTITGIVVSFAFARNRSTIGADSSMPVTDTPFGERYGHATGSDGELRRPFALRESGKAVHGRSQDLGSEHAGTRRVMALSGLGVPKLVLPHDGNGGSGRTACPKGFGARVGG
ncbi:hypothetical protein ACFYSC_01960 [Streptosporangium sp. NPDC004379]|uniref:hypothetical protein n=1 Tax=Streptosporangium sp. NPDC004379 TaxID=3366189 RepID=UPI00367CE1F0